MNYLLWSQSDVDTSVPDSVPRSQADTKEQEDQENTQEEEKLGLFQSFGDILREKRGGPQKGTCKYVTTSFM